jgi:hypothetical protein
MYQLWCLYPVPHIRLQCVCRTILCFTKELLVLVEILTFKTAGWGNGVRDERATKGGRHVNIQLPVHNISTERIGLYRTRVGLIWSKLKQFCVFLAVCCNHNFNGSNFLYSSQLSRSESCTIHVSSIPLSRSNSLLHERSKQGVSDIHFLHHMTQSY